MSLDFFGVIVEGKILTFSGDDAGGRGKFVDLWVSPYNDAVSGTDFRALSFVSQISISLTMNFTAKIQLVLTPPYEDALRFLNSSLIKFGVGELHVSLGYSTGSPGNFRTQPYRGLLQKPDVSIGEDVVITLNALGVGYPMNNTGGSEPSTFPGLSWAGAVETVFRHYAKKGKASKGGSVLPEASRAEIEHGIIDVSELYSAFSEEEQKGVAGDDNIRAFFKNPPDVAGAQQDVEVTAKDAKVPVPVINQGPRSDWWFVRETIKNHGLDIRYSGDKVSVIDPNTWLKSIGAEDGSSSRKHFVLRGQVDPSRNMYPILSFNSPTTAVWMGPGIGRSVAQDEARNKAAAEAAAKKADLENTRMARTAKGGFDPDAVTQISSLPQDASRNIPGDPRDPTVVQQMKAEWKAAQMDGGITGEFTTIGIPSLIPGEVIQASGFQEFGEPASEKGLFNKPYGVIEVTHNIGVEGFTTTFRGISNFNPEGIGGNSKVGKQEEHTPILAIDESKTESSGNVSMIPRVVPPFTDFS